MPSFGADAGATSLVNPLEQVRDTTLRQLWYTLILLLVPAYMALFVMNREQFYDDPGTSVLYLTLLIGTVLLAPRWRWSQRTRGQIAIGLFGTLAIPVLIKTGVRQPSASVSTVVTIALAVMFESTECARGWTIALITAGVTGVVLRSLEIVHPAALLPATTANDVARLVPYTAICIFVAAMLQSALRIYNDARIAELQEYERRLEAERRFRELQRQDLVTTMARGMTHDLANVLQAVTAGVELLGCTNADPQQRRVIDDITNVSERASKTLRSLLTLGAPAGIDGTHASVPELFTRLAALVPPFLGSRITLHLQHHTTRRVVISQESLEQIVLNLVFNARDAMPNGGALTIVADDHAREHTDGTVKDGVRIRVSDTGVGIPRDLMVRIFDPYVTTKPAGSGTGLGLAIVNHIVDGAGGSIDVASQVDAGTTFTCWLPAD